MAETLGLYFHIPFCAGGKCPYCDFYSLPYTREAADRYVRALEKRMESWGERARGRSADTVYFGGGTPALLGARLGALLAKARACFAVDPGAEITLEANPGSVGYEILAPLREAGFNRLSLGMQSAQRGELAALGRRHTPEDTVRAVADARRAGFDNLSLDLMLCTPGQTRGSLLASVRAACALHPEHISAYLLKVEPGTPFARRQGSLALPDEDEQAAMYLLCCEALEEEGLRQYEISNFAHPGFASRHNLRYWDCREYLGLGPAAHSFFEGRRFYYPRDLGAFAAGAPPVPDGEGGSLEEYLMLRLRLSEGVTERQLKERTGKDFGIFPPEKTAPLERAGLIERTPGRLRLTRRGFLVSNSVLSSLIF